MNKLLCAAFLALGLPGAANAADESELRHFRSCDGYPPPTKRGDGIVTGSWLFGLASTNEDIRREGLTASDYGLRECDKALEDAALKSEFLVRRGSLLQAKAFHQLNLGRYDDALATLASIDGIGLDTADPLFERGLGLGNRLLRAFVLVRLDRDAEALADIRAIESERPYTVQVRDTTVKLRLMIDPSLDNHIQLLRETAPFNPLAAIEGFNTALAFGRFDDAIDFASGLSFELPSTRGGWTVEGEEEFEYRRIEFQAELDGAMAYVLAATGDPEGAGRRLVAARERLDAAMAPPPAPANGRAPKESEQRDFRERSDFAKRGLKTLERWQALMVLRTQAPALNGEELLGKIDGFPHGSIPVFADLLGQLGQEDPRVIEAGIRDLLEGLHEERLKVAALDPKELLTVVPRPETPATQVKLKRAGDGYFLSDNGYSRREMDTPDDWTIRFTDNLASIETVEEFGLLAAAEETLRRGYDGFVIQSRRLLERVTNNMMYGTVVNTVNSGREAQLRIRMVHGTELPSDLAGAEWRIVRPKDVKVGLADLPMRR